MSNNVADFLNDNAGVVGATAGYAVRQSIANTNSHLSALRNDLRSLREQIAREQKAEERDRLNRDVLFQVSQQIEAIRGAPVSPEMYFELVRAAEEFQSLGFSSASFSSLQDKTFFSNLSTSIDQTFTSIWEKFAEETREQIADVVDLHILTKCGDAVAIADEQIAGAQASLEATLTKATLLENNAPRFLSNKPLAGLMIGALSLGVVLAALAWIASPKPVKWESDFMIEEARKDPYGMTQSKTQYHLGAYAAGSFAIAGILGFVLLIKFTSKDTKRSAEIEENRKDLQYLNGHLASLNSHRSALTAKISQLQRVPIEAVNVLTSETVSPSDRFDIVEQNDERLAEMCSHLGLDVTRLPTIPELQANGGRLANSG